MPDLQHDFNEVLEIASSTTTLSGTYQIDPEMRFVDVESEIVAVAGAAPTIDVTPQFSSDQVNWVSATALTQQTATGTEKSRAAKSKTYMRFSVVTAGTFTSASVRLFAQAVPGEDTGAIDGETYVTSVLGMIGAVVTDVTNMVAVIIGKATTLFTDAFGRLIITKGTKDAGEDLVHNVMRTERQGTGFAISTATTTLVDSGDGHINSIRVLGGTLGNVTIYDALSATGTPTVPTVTPIAGGVLLEDIGYSVGLTIVTAAATVIVGSIR